MAPTSTIRSVALFGLNTAQPAVATLVNRSRRTRIQASLLLALALILALTLLAPGDAAAQSARRVNVTTSPVCEGVPMTFTITLPAGAAVSDDIRLAVTYTTSIGPDDTAQSGINFTATSGSFDFDLSDPKAQSHTVTVETLFRDNTTTGDTTAPKTFSLTTTYWRGLNTIPNDITEGEIKDCRNVVTLLPSNPQVVEGDDIEFTITVQNIESNADPKGIITYSVNKLTGPVSGVDRNDTADAGTDFTVMRSTWVPMPNAQPPVLTKTFTASTLNNDPESMMGAEGNETFSAYLSANDHNGQVKNLHLHGPDGAKVGTLVSTIPFWTVISPAWL